MSGAVPALGALNLPVALQVPTLAQTPSGGQARTWVTVSTIWIRLEAQEGLEVVEPGLPPRRRDRALVVARDHPAIRRGVQLSVAGEPAWRVLSVRRRDPVAGYLALSVEREA